MSESPKTCWTCRIRKKRCDRKRPACSACRSLDITCHDGDSRPSWVDNDRERDEFADQIKAQIREKAECRREKSYVKVMPLGRGKRSKDGLKIAGRLSKADKHKRKAQVPEESLVKLPGHEPSRSNMSFAEDSRSDSHPSDPALLGVENDIDLDLEIIFLDYAFPFLFPFYRPSIFEGGRGWLLATLRSSRPLFHTAMGFSTYFFTLIMMETVNDQDSHEGCKRIIEGKLTSHIDTAIKAMRKGIQDLHASKNPISVFGRAHLMEGVIQLLVFETNIAGTTEWSIHITAAVSLLKEILELPETHDGIADLTSVFAMMQRPGWSTETPNHRIWNSDQSAFLFHVAFIIFADIISATILGDIPKLRECYKRIFKDKVEVTHPSQVLELGSFVGCQGWILLVADIAALVEGKKQGRVSHNNLLLEGNRIAKDLHDGITNLNTNLEQPMATTVSFQAYVHPETLLLNADTTPISLIWAHATALYLFVTTSGWQEHHKIVEENISSALHLLQQISSPAILRTLAWPYCLVGCLAAKNQEAEFRQIASRMGSLSAFGTLNEALKIMEKVWSTRGEKDVESWDFTCCFRILGSVPLLI
jgi:hypothetical protein